MQEKPQDGFKVKNIRLSEKIKDAITSHFQHRNKAQNKDDAQSNDVAGLEGALKHLNFPLRQLFRPSVPYPLWDYRWNKHGRNGTRKRTTRHIFLIRHGQYEEHHRSDSLNNLTILGRKQAKACGKRLAAMIKHNNNKSGKCSGHIMVTSNLSRAKETGDIIESQLQEELDENIEIREHDPLLNECHPAHHIPGSPLTEQDIESWDTSHASVEKAFEKYFIHPIAKTDESLSEANLDSKQDLVHDVESHHSSGQERHLMPMPSSPHEFEILVTHSNVIRYFTCRALQIPPEAWLRFSLYNASITYLIVTRCV